MKLFSSALLLCFLLLGNSVQAQQANIKPLVYSLRLVTLCDTRPAQTIWLVDGKPDFAYKSLDSPSFLKWVSELPKSTEIDYRSRTEGLPLADLFKTKSISDAEDEKKLQAFEVFCHSKGVIFAHRFPVL